MTPIAYPAPTGELALIFCDVQDSKVLWDRTAAAMHDALTLYERLMG